MKGRIRILGIAGSIRKNSYNRALLREAVGLCPPEGEIRIADIAGIPPFNQDDEANPPASVAELKRQVRESDAVLFVTPEYNYSVPGVLKNAIDWASRPYTDNVWAGKPVAVMSASVGMLGGARAQYHLRQTFVFLDMHPVNKPEVFITFAPQKFDSEMHLRDEDARRFISELLSNLISLTAQLKK